MESGGGPVRGWVLTLAPFSSMTGATVNGMANGVVALEKDRNVKRKKILRSTHNRHRSGHATPKRNSRRPVWAMVERN